MVLQVLYIYRTMLAGTKKITTIQVLLSMEQDDLARRFPIDIAVQMRGRQRLKKMVPRLEACRVPQNGNLKAPTGFTATSALMIPPCSSKKKSVR